MSLVTAKRSTAIVRQQRTDRQKREREGEGENEFDFDGESGESPRACCYINGQWFVCECVWLFVVLGLVPWTGTRSASCRVCSRKIVSVFLKNVGSTNREPVSSVMQNRVIGNRWRVCGGGVDKVVTGTVIWLHGNGNLLFDGSWKIQMESHGIYGFLSKIINVYFVG